MISSIIDAVLLAALAATSTCVLLMYRRLKAFDIMQGQAATEFARTADALERARRAMASLQDDGGEMAVSLAAKLNEGRMMINELETIAGNVINKVASGELDEVIGTDSDQSLAETASAQHAKNAAADLAATRGALGSGITRSPTVAMRLREAAAIAAARARRDASAPAARSPVTSTSGTPQRTAPLDPPAGDIGDLVPAAAWSDAAPEENKWANATPVGERWIGAKAIGERWAVARSTDETWPDDDAADDTWPSGGRASSNWPGGTPVGDAWSDETLAASEDAGVLPSGPAAAAALDRMHNGARPLGGLTWSALADAARNKN